MASPTTPAETFDVAVIGGGVMGLATAWNLLRLGAGRVALIERSRLGHDGGGSHGKSRITRSAYAQARYAHLMRVARAEDWPRLERDAGVRLIHPSPGCFFGPPSAAIESYARSVVEAGADAERIPPAEAARRFPALRFDPDTVAIDDRTAGLVAAEETVRALERLVRDLGATVLEGCEVRGVLRDGAPLWLDTSHGLVEAARVVVTAGGWARRVVPDLARRPLPVRQTVAYLRLDAPAAQCALGAFPVWAHLDSDVGLHFYGLPEFGREGVKIARHVADGEDDPDETPGEPDPAEIARIVGFARSHFTAKVLDVVAVERCMYACTPTEDFVLAAHPHHPRLVVGAGFSGHGFKFAPLAGRILAELVLHGHTTVPAFEAERPSFSWW